MTEADERGPYVLQDQSLPLMRLVVEGAPPSEIIRGGLEAKRALWALWVRMVQDGNVIDTIVTKYANPKEWRWNIVDPDAPPVSVGSTTAITPTTNRPASQASTKDKILTLARQLKDSDDVVRTMEIARELQRAGDQRDLRNLATSVGNTLSRNGWSRLRDGQYMLTATQEALIEATRQ